ncbi:MAG: TIGR02452 family protein [Lachnospiraceae bacterium]|nr:TIGR02452 family protein [Lachnospiraceae bacterium]
MSREENVRIFENTKRICEGNEKIKKAIRMSTGDQCIVYENDAKGEFPHAVDHKYEEKAKIVVSKKRSYEAAAGYKGMKTCVHNFASATTPGGGVVKGSSAQEECLCRTSTLYFSINEQEMWDKFYLPHRRELDNIHNDDLIYTPGVIVMKTDTAKPKLMPEEDWYSVDVITLAAPKLRGGARRGEKPRCVTDKELLAIHEKRMRRFFDIAKAFNEEVLILGAFGCGAYMNSPQVVAQAMKNILPEYLYDFKAIEFAVYCPPTDNTNFKVFERVLKGLE